MLYKETNWDRNTKNNKKIFYFIFKWKVLELSTSRTHDFFDGTFQFLKIPFKHKKTLSLFWIS